jgi:predicted regulator of amino acid metabolism with ACT domain
MKLIITEEQLSTLKDSLDGHLPGENEPIRYAVIEITIPMAYLSPKWNFQIVPLWHTIQDRIYINKGVAGGKSISTKSIKIRKIFGEDQKEEMERYLHKIREEYWESVKQYYK